MGILWVSVVMTCMYSCIMCRWVPIQNSHLFPFQLLEGFHWKIIYMMMGGGSLLCYQKSPTRSATYLFSSKWTLFYINVKDLFYLLFFYSSKRRKKKGDNERQQMQSSSYVIYFIKQISNILFPKIHLAILINWANKYDFMWLFKAQSHSVLLFHIFKKAFFNNISDI